MSLQPPSSKHHPQSQPNPPQSLKASNYNYHWAPLYLTNDLEPTTWTNNQKQDANMTPPLTNDTTSCMPFSQSKMMNSHPKITTSHKIAAPHGTNHHTLPSQTPSKSPHQTLTLKTTLSKSHPKSKRKNLTQHSPNISKNSPKQTKSYTDLIWS